MPCDKKSTSQNSNNMECEIEPVVHARQIAEYVAEYICDGNRCNWANYFIIQFTDEKEPTVLVCFARNSTSFYLDTERLARDIETHDSGFLISAFCYARDRDIKIVSSLQLKVCEPVAISLSPLDEQIYEPHAAYIIEHIM
ncbi:MAG: hypothetical protein M0R33_17140 [Methylomonas sp.]|jgi:hypothetical protein|nr:hypothetical protein [Methylomonas sp.]